MTRLAAFVALVAAAGPLAAQGGADYAARFAATCAPCHGAQGVSTTPLTPTLAGQPGFYAITQLFLFRDGRRNDHPESPAMTAVARGMSDADLRGYAQAIEQLPVPPPAAASAVDAARMARGATLTARLHCTGCHGSDLVGGRQVPRLAGQREDYLLHALRGFRAATRIGYSPAMTEALAGTTPAELEDLAHYLAHAGTRRVP